MSGDHARLVRRGTRRAFRSPDGNGWLAEWVLFCASLVFREGAGKCARGGHAPGSISKFGLNLCVSDFLGLADLSDAAALLVCAGNLKTNLTSN